MLALCAFSTRLSPLPSVPTSHRPGDPGAGQPGIQAAATRCRYLSMELCYHMDIAKRDVDNILVKMAALQVLRLNKHESWSECGVSAEGAVPAVSWPLGESLAAVPHTDESRCRTSAAVACSPHSVCCRPTPGADPHSYPVPLLRYIRVRMPQVRLGLLSYGASGLTDDEGSEDGSSGSGWDSESDGSSSSGWDSGGDGGSSSEWDSDGSDDDDEDAPPPAGGTARAGSSRQARASAKPAARGRAAARGCAAAGAAKGKGKQPAKGKAAVAKPRAKPKGRGAQGKGKQQQQQRKQPARKRKGGK